MVESFGSHANWFVAGVSQADGRLLHVGFFEPRDGALMYNWGYSRAQGSFPVLTLVRVLSWSPRHATLMANPTTELQALRNGSLFHLQGVRLAPGEWHELLAPTQRDAGAAMDMEVSLALPPSAVSFSVQVLAGSSPEGNATIILLAVDAPDADGQRRGNLSITLPRLAVNCSGQPASQCPGMGPGWGWAVWGPPVAPFVLLSNESSLDLRVLVDRSVVEVFGAGGRAVVSVRDFPKESETTVRVSNSISDSETALVMQTAHAWSMDCGWVR